MFFSYVVLVSKLTVTRRDYRVESVRGSGGEFSSSDFTVFTQTP